MKANSSISILNVEQQPESHTSATQSTVRCTYCIHCLNFNSEDNYCKLLQINWLPDGFGCTKGRTRNS